jgi:vancomycin resistance protein YoaR
MQKINKNLIIVSLIMLFLLAPIALVLALNFKYQNTSFPRIFLNNKSYTDFSRQAAQKSLENDIQEKYKDGMQLVYKDKVYKVALPELGIQIDTTKSVEEVFSYGHRQNIPESLKEQFSLLGGDVNFQNKIIEKDFLIDKPKWEEISKIETPAKNFSYEWNGKDFAEAQAEEGFVIDQAKLKKDIAQNLVSMQNNPVKIELVKDEPLVREDAYQKALLKAKNLTGKEIVLKYDSYLSKVASDDFNKWIGFAPQKGTNGDYSLVLSPNIKEIKDYLVSIVPQIDHQPVNAQLEFKDGKVGVFSLSQDGVQMDMEKSAQKIGDEIFREENYKENTGDKKVAADAIAASADKQNGSVQTTNPNQISVELAAKKIAPELTTEKIDNMGITSLLATGESNFHGSTKSRIHNVTVGAGKFNGVLIGPGDTFSFDKILGEVGPKQGYLPELVIKQGQTTPEYGGGLCQVSTTAFRGAVNAGLEVTARTNHAYAVKYYDPQGTDATIYPPNPDLVFINNTPAYILIQTRISGLNLYFDYYGTNDGRKVTLEGPVVYERGTAGAMKTWWKQSVYDKDGKLFLTKTFYSNYKSATLYPRTNPLD